MNRGNGGSSLVIRSAVVCAALAAFACAREAQGTQGTPGTPGSGAARPQGAQSPTAGAEATAALPAGAVRVEKAAIVDPSGFEQPMVAATLFLPHGWKTEGGVQWGQQYMCTNGYAFQWSATSPDGSTKLAVLPQERWEWNNFGAPASSPGCPLVQITNVRQYLEGLVQRLRPGARPVGYRVREDLQQQFAALQSHTPMPLGELRTWVEAGELTVEYSEEGREMRGSVAAVAVLSLMRSDAGMGVMETLNGATFPAYAASAPKDRFDPAFFEAIRRSIKLDPRWDARIADHNNVIARSALQAAQKRAEITRRTNEEIAKIREDAWNAYQESSDRRFREFSEVIRDVETYRDPDAPGGEVQLSSFYEHAWRLNDGTYVLTNDPSFEPYRYTGQDGERLGKQP